DASWKMVKEDDRPRAYQVIAGGGEELPPFVIFENTTVLPRAFVVPEAASAPPPAPILEALKTTDFRRRVFLEGCAPASSRGTLRPAVIRSYRPNRIVVELDGAAGILVLADVWYPGWTCRVDGTETPVRRANYLFRAIEVPAGAREAVFVFDPPS